MNLGKIEFTKRFHKSFALLSHKDKDLFKAKLEIFKHDPYAPILKMHRLKGKLLNKYSFSLRYDLRCVIFFENNKVVFQDIGPHSRVY